MWRRAASTQLRALTSEWRSAFTAFNSTRSLTSSPSSQTRPLQNASAIFSQKASSDADMIMSKSKKRVEDIMPIATGHEKEELEAELEGRNILEINYPVGPFGTKEAPAVVKSVYDKRIVGCPGGEGEDEHDVVWFWLEKGKPHECPVCTQYFVLEVVGHGGSPDGHDDDH